MITFFTNPGKIVARRRLPLDVIEVADSLFPDTDRGIGTLDALGVPHQLRTGANSFLSETEMYEIAYGLKALREQNRGMAFRNDKLKDLITSVGGLTTRTQEIVFSLASSAATKIRSDVQEPMSIIPIRKMKFIDYVQTAEDLQTLIAQAVEEYKYIVRATMVTRFLDIIASGSQDVGAIADLLQLSFSIRTYYQGIALPIAYAFMPDELPPYLFAHVGINEMIAKIEAEGRPSAGVMTVGPRIFDDPTKFSLNPNYVIGDGDFTRIMGPNITRVDIVGSRITTMRDYPKIGRAHV